MYKAKPRTFMVKTMITNLHKAAGDTLRSYFGCNGNRCSEGAGC